MANSYYQTPTTPRLYVSYPLWQYANGGLTIMYNGGNPTLTQENMIKLIQLDPSSTVNIVDDNDNGAIIMGYNVVDRPRIDNNNTYTGDLPSNLWNFNYCMVLNHNFATRNARIQFGQVDGNSNNPEFWGGTAFQTLDNQSIINWNTSNSPSNFDGFSAFTLNGASAVDKLGVGFYIHQPSGAADLPFYGGPDIEIGTLMWGKYWDFPQNCDLSTTLAYEYGTSSVKSVGGKSINTTQWTKPDSWYNQATGGTEPFGLRKPNDDYNDTADSFRRKSGLRVWNISFDSLAPKYVMNQNPMMNSQGWDSNFDNYSVDADNITSTYNIDSGLDFYTDVVHKTNGGSISMVMQVDKDDPSPQNFAIVKMSKYTITQKAPNLYSFSLTLEEQV